MAKKKHIFLLLVVAIVALIYLCKTQLNSNGLIINETSKNEKRIERSRLASKSENSFKKLLRDVHLLDEATKDTNPDLLEELKNALKKVQRIKAANARKDDDIEKEVDKEWKMLVGDDSRERTGPKSKTTNKAHVRQIPSRTGKSSLPVLERVLRTIPYEQGQGHFPNNSPCPYLGLRKVYNAAKEPQDKNISCMPPIPQEKDCKLANKAYKRKKKNLKCTTNKPVEDLCVFQETWRSSADMPTHVRCDLTACGGNRVQLIGIDSDYGILADVEKWHEFATSGSLEEFIPEFVSKNSAIGLQFCYLRCRKPNRQKFIKQILSFPPIIEKSDSPLNKNLFNFNVLVLDSVSRAHFYRSLPQTVKAMRRIVHDDTRQATVLDFELLQSLAPYTFYNMRAFMSGITKENGKQDYGIDSLYGLLRSKGYYTMLQEDSCWYDPWGSLLTNNVHHNKTPSSFEEFAKRWEIFSDQIHGYHVDDLGLSHTACDVFRQYGETNQFEQQKICFSNRPYGEFFLQYIGKVLQAYRDSGKKRPVFAYTHLNVGHELSGNRIRQIDDGLSSFVLSMAKDRNTLTMILSDHGPKTTKFSFRTMAGRAETYDSLLFMILPKKVAEKLGMQRTRALFTNQRRLLTALDLHNAIVSFVKPSKGESQGVFAEVSPQRTCTDLTMKHSVVCKCANWEKLYRDNYANFTWLAEFAIGEINNSIQKEFLSTGDNEYGFGKCQRLVGYSFEKVRHRVEKGKNVVTMDIIVKPMYEIFEAQFRFPRTSRGNRNLVKLSSLRRISIYRHFRHCVDAQVPLDHCVCNNKFQKTRRKRIWNWAEVKSNSDILNIIKRTTSFGSRTAIRNLHGNCLLWLSRKHQRTVVYEIANACSNRKYQVRVAGRSKGTSISSRDLPFSITVRPLTIHFLFSVYHVKRPYGYYIKTHYKTVVEKNEK